jgi:hypothetical protein
MIINPNDPIHFSEISTFLQCEYRHQLNYIHQIVPRRTKTSMAFGTLGHAALKALIKGEDVGESVSKEIKEKFQNDLILQEVRRIGDSAVKVSNRVFEAVQREFKYRTILAEQQIECVIEGILFRGTPDWVIEDDYGNWVVDHKFRKTFYPGNSEDVNLQMFVYQRLIKESLGIDTVGSRQLQIQPRIPEKPEILKNGKLSKKDIWSDWETYRQAVIDNGEDEKDYEDMKLKLDKKKWFDINECKTRRTPEEIRRVWDSVIIPASHRIIQNKQSGKEAIRAMNHFNCKNCDMLEYCIEDLKGGDLEFLMCTNYKLKGELSHTEIIVELEDDV